MKKVYVGMSADFIHEGHINVINLASKYGDVIIGLLTDEAIASYKRVPLTTYKQRKKVISAINGVSKVVEQKTLDYEENLRQYKPDYVVHALTEDWKKGVQKETRQKVIDILKEWNGELIEPEPTKGISSTMLIEDKISHGVTPETRQKKLSRLLKTKKLVRVIEAHNGLSALIAEKTNIVIGNEKREFDALWESSLTDSASKGKPDIELVDFTSRTQTINQILEVSTKPVIVDGDTGGQTDYFVYMVKTLERLGVSAVIIEDKRFPKQNSLLEKANHIQEDIDVFSDKIRAGVHARITNNFLIIARLESMILGKGSNDALERAKAYIAAGADGIMIHSKKTEFDEIKEFCSKYNKLKNKVFLVAVPSTYNKVYEDELIEQGVNIVIYANHLIRSCYVAMEKTAKNILKHQRSKETDQDCLPIKELLKII